MPPDLGGSAEPILPFAHHRESPEPIRHRLGVTYEDDCLRLGLTWRRDYATTGDAQRGNSFILALAFKNLGR